jgi:hypothetical protein
MADIDIVTAGGEIIAPFAPTAMLLLLDRLGEQPEGPLLSPPGLNRQIKSLTRSGDFGFWNSSQV